MNSRSQTARLPPSGLARIQPEWSRLVTAVDLEGVERTWHVLDNGVSGPIGTILCVHGNPNWSYMWRTLVASMNGWRVVAVDALNMGFSERTGAQRRLAERVSDLGAVTAAMDITGPVVTVAHDWGGPISMGWAQRHRDQLAGIVLMNTGVARPVNVKVPSLISIARSSLRTTCETTPAFLHGALRMARPQLSREVYRGYVLPYGSAELRTGIKDFVEDIPILETHESHATLAAIADGLADLSDVPTLLLWGAKDIVFSDDFLHDLRQRLPHADVQRFADAGHQIVEDTDALSVAEAWIQSSSSPRAAEEAGPRQPREPRDPQEPQEPREPREPMWAAIAERRDDGARAIVEMDADDPSVVARTISFDELDRRIHSTAAGLIAGGVRPGERLAALVAPGIDLTVLVYACLRSGIVLVLADAALGLSGMRWALRSARPDHVVGDVRGLAVAKSLRLPARRISITALSDSKARLLNAADSLAAIETSAAGLAPPTPPADADVAALVFTSGSTGPSKGVLYTHGQLQAQRDMLIEAFGVGAEDTLVVAFAPFAVLAPAVGITSVIPAMNVMRPATLTAQALAAAAHAVDGTIVFASPAVLANIAATAGEANCNGIDRTTALAKVRTVATAGAPVSPQLLDAVTPVFPNAQVFTPYGMTEVLPVTVSSAAEISAVGSDNGVCVGRSLAGVDVAVRPFDAASGTLPEPLAVGTLGEIWVRSEHGCAGYDGLWHQDRHAFVDGWHRSGDVGHLDAQGCLWIEGRVEHLIHGPDGAIAPVEIELQAETVPGVERAAAVGVGPVGNQQLVVVVSGPTGAAEVSPGRTKASAVAGPLAAGPGVAGPNVGAPVVAGPLAAGPLAVGPLSGGPVVAGPDLAAAVRSAVTTPVAAVLVARQIPVDRRHNSKIDRGKVRAWAEALLRGHRQRRLGPLWFRR